MYKYKGHITVTRKNISLINASNFSRENSYSEFEDIRNSSNG